MAKWFRVLVLQCRDPGFKVSTLPLAGYSSVANWSASYQLGFLTMLRSFDAQRN